jgi:hypothetical protein
MSATAAGDYRAERSARPTGSHWESMRPVEEHLAHELVFMRDAVRFWGDVDDSRGELSALAERLEVAPDADPFELLEGWALEVRRLVDGRHCARRVRIGDRRSARRARGALRL